MSTSSEQSYPCFLQLKKVVSMWCGAWARSSGQRCNSAANDGGTPLLMAAHKGCLNVMRCLGKELGADVNKTGLFGRPALMEAP